MAKAEPKVVTKGPIATAAPAKTEAPKADAKPAAARGPKGVDLNAKITVLKTENPKRPGSRAAKEWGYYKDQMTVGEAIAAGITTPGLVYDASHAFIKIEGYEPKLVPVKEKAPPKSKEEKAAPAAKAGGKNDELK